MKTVTVVAAVIFNGDEILCVQRPENKYDYISKKFEFPGGKIEDGETEIEALRREIKEELHLDLNEVIFFQVLLIYTQILRFYCTVIYAPSKQEL